MRNGGIQQILLLPRLLSVLLIICLLYAGCVPTYFGKSKLKETEVHPSDAKITSVLFVGVGSTPSRLFLENLSTEVIKLFSQYHVNCDFVYAGKIPRKSHYKIEKVMEPKYEAYLLLNPIDTSYMNNNKSVASFGMPTPGGGSVTGSKIGNQYIESFYVTLYTNKDSINKIWQAELKVDFDVAKPARNKQIAADIFDKLLKNGIVSKN